MIFCQQKDQKSQQRKPNMKAVLFLSLSILILGVKGWPPMKSSFDVFPEGFKVHTISDCMHVASESGDYVFKKVPHLIPPKETDILEMSDSMTVCGLYVIGEPDTIVEITMKYYDVNCETGGLMAFVDGWELNGEYFPGIHDHHKARDDRVVEFCNNYNQWPPISNKKFFRSSQNAALLQYRILVRGSFIANVRFHKITQPCNILVHDTAAIYQLSNFGQHKNCTLSALFPAVVALGSLKIGGKNVLKEKPNYECNMDDRLQIGGTSGLDSNGLELSSEVCGYSEERGPEQAIFCGITTVRLLSTGKYQNVALIALRKADENDLEIATLVCPL